MWRTLPWRSAVVPFLQYREAQSSPSPISPSVLLENLPLPPLHLRAHQRPSPHHRRVGEKSDPEPVSAYTQFPDPDPPIESDEWGASDNEFAAGNGSAQVEIGADGGGDANLELKRCLVYSVYGTDFGFKASPEVRAEVSELVNQLEAANPNPNPIEDPALLDGNWDLLYTAFSELLPLLAVGNTPLLKVETISQSISTSDSVIENSTTFSTPYASFSFSANATFEVRSPSRIQVTGNPYAL